MQNFDKTAFRQKVRSLVVNGEFAKVAEAITPYVRLRLYEESFADRVLAVRTVTESDLQVEVADDSFYVVANVEQGTERAVVANFIDRPIEDYIKGARYKIPLGIHKTRQRRKNVHELKAYDYDILSDAADKDIFELGNLKDWKMLLMLQKCIDLSGKSQTDVQDTAITGPVQVSKIHFNRLGATLNTGGRTGVPSADRLQVAKYLTHRQLIDDLALLDHTTFGDPLTGDMFQKGVTVTSVLGTEYIASIKERFFTEHDAVAYATITGTANAGGETITIDGNVIAITGSGAAAAAAAELVTGVDALTGFSATDLTGGVVRIVKTASANETDRTFNASFTTAASETTHAVAFAAGVDGYDVIWAFPEPQFLGELIRVAGSDVETEMWKTNGEEMVNAVSREYFGMGLGNYNGVAKVRIQRSYFPAP
jgi:hypothetical protein